MENFVLYDEIAKTETGTTYKGRRKGTVTFLAIACVEKASRAPVTNHVRFVSELGHPHVAKFLEWYETTNHLWLVFELCSGGDLATLIKQDGALPETTIRQFAADLVRALHYLHSGDIVYGDLCPTKILLDSLGRLKLGDFALAFKNGENLADLYFHFVNMAGETDGEAGGSGGGDPATRDLPQPQLDWQAPELVRGDQPAADYKSDLWSLGVLLHQMFCGTLPFTGATPKEVADAIVYKAVPSARVKGTRLTGKPSPDFLDLMAKLLDKDPDARMDWPELISHPFWHGCLAELASANALVSPRKSAVTLDQTLESVRQSLRASRSHHLQLPGADGGLARSRSVSGAALRPASALS